MRPHVVKEIREPVDNMAGPGELVKVIEPEVLNLVDVGPENIKVVQEGMREVTMPGGGTAYSTFAGLPFNVAAKTGTAQRGGGTTNGLMVGYAPYEDPEVVFVVVVPGGAGGSDSAGPMARRLLQAFYGLDKAPEPEVSTTEELTTDEPASDQHP
jgi:cell division protein FtsI/penicillin-binding protein 2